MELIHVAILDIAVIKTLREVSLKRLDVSKVEGRLQPEAKGPTFGHRGNVEVGGSGEFFEESFIFWGGEFFDGNQSVNEGLGQKVWGAEKPGAGLSVSADLRNAIGNGDVFGGQILLEDLEERFEISNPDAHEDVGIGEAGESG